MSIYIGSSKIDKMYLGSTPISRAYVGSNEVFSPMNFYKLIGDGRGDNSTVKDTYKINSDLSITKTHGSIFTFDSQGNSYICRAVDSANFEIIRLNTNLSETGRWSFYRYNYNNLLVYDCEYCTESNTMLIWLTGTSVNYGAVYELFRFDANTGVTRCIKSSREYDSISGILSTDWVYRWKTTGLGMDVYKFSMTGADVEKQFYYKYDGNYSTQCCVKNSSELFIFCREYQSDIIECSRFNFQTAQKLSQNSNVATGRIEKSLYVPFNKALYIVYSIRDNVYNVAKLNGDSLSVISTKNIDSLNGFWVRDLAFDDSLIYAHVSRYISATSTYETSIVTFDYDFKFINRKVITNSKETLSSSSQFIFTGQPLGFNSSLY